MGSREKYIIYELSSAVTRRTPGGRRNRETHISNGTLGKSNLFVRILFVWARNWATFVNLPSWVQFYSASGPLPTCPACQPPPLDIITQMDRLKIPALRDVQGEFSSIACYSIGAFNYASTQASDRPFIYDDVILEYGKMTDDNVIAVLLTIEIAKRVTHQRIRTSLGIGSGAIFTNLGYVEFFGARGPAADVSRLQIRHRGDLTAYMLTVFMT
ncbi:hypothetical protein EVAR_97883_1 [Eumeta japonica]|uniref:Uncharacterized protein n=1 Tax=Eumeta variegata TaxID=151549 RepID=A0A4C1WDW1_EUMVA|nr:hypothetical protein EVAR_97883_1 [Eumeta japonica]